MDDSSYIKKLKSRLRESPGSRLALSFAEELRKKDRIDDAITVLIDYIRKKPDFNPARLTLGRWYLSSDMLPEAKNVLSELIDMEPGNANAHKSLAEVYVRLGDAEAAAEQYRLVLESSPFDMAADAYLKSAGYSVKKEEKAVAVHAGMDRDRTVERLNFFMETIKKRFAAMERPEDISLRMGNVAERLNFFLYAIRQRFAGAGAEGGFLRRDNAIERLNSFLIAVKQRFAEERSEDRDCTIGRLNSLLAAIHAAFRVGKDYKIANTER